MIVETDLEPGANSRLQARSPAQSIQSDPTPSTGIATEGVQVSEPTGTYVRSEDERETAFERGSRDGKTGERPAQLATSSEQREQTITLVAEDERRGSNDRRLGEQPINRSSDSGERRTPVNRGSKSGETGERSRRKRGSKKMDRRSEQLNPLSVTHLTTRTQMIENTDPANSTLDYAPSGDGLSGEQSQWLKTILPGASGGWWDVYQKDNGFAVKFRWRDQGRQTLTFPRISYQHLHALRQSAPEETGRIMREQISDSLRRFLIDSDKRDKALLVARKLGINPDDLQKFTTAR